MFSRLRSFKRPLSTQSRYKSERVVIAGGGFGGLVTANLLNRKGVETVLVEPSEHHYYQPGWTLVGGGLMNKEETHLQTKSYIPTKCTWVQKKSQNLNQKTM